MAWKLHGEGVKNSAISFQMFDFSLGEAERVIYEKGMI